MVCVFYNKIVYENIYLGAHNRYFPLPWPSTLENGKDSPYINFFLLKGLNFKKLYPCRLIEDPVVAVRTAVRRGGRAQSGRLPHAENARRRRQGQLHHLCAGHAGHPGRSPLPLRAAASAGHRGRRAAGAADRLALEAAVSQKMSRHLYIQVLTMTTTWK